MKKPYVLNGSSGLQRNKHSMRYFLLLITLFIFCLGSAQEKTITGVVTSKKTSLTGVSISVKEKKRGTMSDKEGAYQINASPKDIIVYSFLGMKDIEVVVEDVTSELNIEMIPFSQQLDEVVVKKRKKKTYSEKLVEYETNTELIKTAYGFLDKGKFGMSLNIIDESEFLPGTLTFAEAIRGRFNGRIVYDGSPFVSVKIFLRERPNLMSGPQPAVIDLDGVITSADAALAIPVSEIKRIAILRSLSASSRYGSRAIGGVIIINTKTGKIKPPSDAIKFKDLKTAQAEFIDENFCKPALEAAQPNRLKKLFLAKSETDAIEKFNQEKAFFEDSPFVLIDAGSYFSTRWKNKEKAKEIWNEVKVKYADNTNVLKVIAYYFEQVGSLKEALTVYQRVSALRPDYAQTYRDLANMHNQLNNQKQALNLYTKYLKKQNKNTKETDTKGISYIMNIEALNILSKNKMKISKDFKDFDVPFDGTAARVILEWNNGEAEFDVEMIHENQSYLVWNHSYEANAAKIKEEKELGYSTEQFFINKEAIGKLDFNIKYLGNKSEAPSYLKVTIQYNYGIPSQKDEVKVIRLSKKTECLRLTSI